MTTKVLMVDDAGSAIELVRSYIEEYDILGAKSGDEMWRVLEKDKPELILLDIILPGEDGFQLAGRLSRDDRYSDIPIIFISARNTGKDVLEGLKLDVYDYIKKPFDKFELLARINATLKRKELENKLKESSIRDSLTGCFNRKYFYERINQHISIYSRTKTNFAVALLDLDNFKGVNDTFGHLAGDHVLSEFSAALRKHVRDYDIPVRFGGEEFAVLYPESSRKEAENSVLHVKNYLKESPPVYENNRISFTFTCGIVEVSEAPKDQKITFESLIKIADERLYRGKKLGKDIIISE